jgi:DNA polymerase I-like protein with 3'-5' exonuclease and polymerase domains
MTQTLTPAQFCALADIEVLCFHGPEEAEELEQAVRGFIQSGEPIGVDTETTGLDPIRNRVRLVQLGLPERAIVVDLDGFRSPREERQVDWSTPGLRAVAELLLSSQRKVLQNAAFDINFLRGEGLELGGPIFDTMIAAKIKNNGSGAPNNLGAIVERELGEPLSKELQKADWSGEITEDMLRYAGRDVCCLPRLVDKLGEKLNSSRVSERVTLSDIFKLEMMCLRPISLMQWYGFGFDLEAAHRLRVGLVELEIEKKLGFLKALDAAIKKEHPEDPTKWLPQEDDGTFNTREKTSGSIRLGTKRYAGFNPRSTQQMAQRFEDAGILLPPNEKGLPSLDQNLLSFLRADYKLVNQYLVWKEHATSVSHIDTLIGAVAPDGRIHAGYRQMGTDTGRLSCAEPNLQQVPREREFRSLFVAPPGWSLVVADFSQVELRVAAELSGEERMLTAYRAGRDLHTETAVLLTGKTPEDITKAERQSGKVANFGLLFGAGAATLRKQAMAQYGVDMDLKEAQAIVSGFRRAYPRLYEWQQDQGSQTTMSVITRYGRRRLMVGRNDKYTTRINTQVQGTAGDICKISIAMLYEQIKDKAACVRLISTVHDELVLEVLDDEVDQWSSKLKECMEAAGALVCRKVPIVAEVSCGKSWADAK